MLWKWSGFLLSKTLPVPAGMDPTPEDLVEPLYNIFKKSHKILDRKEEEKIKKENNQGNTKREQEVAARQGRHTFQRHSNSWVRPHWSTPKRVSPGEHVCWSIGKEWEGTRSQEKLLHPGCNPLQPPQCHLKLLDQLSAIHEDNRVQRIGAWSKVEPFV